MQCSVNVLIEWESGETSWQPLHRKDNAGTYDCDPYQLYYGWQTDAQRHPDVPNQHAERRPTILDFEVILQFRSRLISLFL